MTLAHVIFIILGLAAVGCAAVVVIGRNLFHSAIFLAFAFVAIAGLYLMLDAEFMAGIQVLVYVGAIVTLIIFGIMVSRDIMNARMRAVNRQWIAGAVVALLVFVALAVILVGAQWPAPAGEPSPDLIADLGMAMVGPYVLPFEVASVLLLVAMVGSIIIARDH